jgi:hypothetical protein
MERPSPWVREPLLSYDMKWQMVIPRRLHPTVYASAPAFSPTNRPVVLHGVPGGIVGFGCSSALDDCLVSSNALAAISSMNRFNDGR